MRTKSRPIQCICQRCGQQFEAESWRVDHGLAGVYCSRSCRNTYDPIDIRLQRLLDKTGGPQSCWSWSGPVNGSGYGGIFFEGRPQGAHRVAWQLEYGPIPQGMLVLHTCDNRRCCNPTHLFLGTQRDNIRDCQAKGRANDDAKGHRGSAHVGAKLTEADVEAIREATKDWRPGRDPVTGRYRPSPIKAIAKQYGVSLPIIYQVVRRKIWTHV